eukprot:11186531-Lingulodinium_polyedra.AAC.1
MRWRADGTMLRGRACSLGHGCSMNRPLGSAVQPSRHAGSSIGGERADRTQIPMGLHRLQDPCHARGFTA